MNNERIQLLTERFFSGEATEAEKEELAAWMDTDAGDADLLSALADEYTRMPADLEMPEEMQQRILTAVFKQHQKPTTSIRIRSIFGWLSAAAVILLMATVAYRWILPRPGTPLIAVVKDVLPGKNGAVLTLSNGATIVLDSLGNGIIAKQGGTSVQLKDGEVLYDAGQNNAAAPTVYNTMTTPRGRQYKLVLPDGTRAWLNAASSIRYPTAFTGNDRNVEISGEVYFEVAKDEKKPFNVTVNDMTVAVLGTSFNINSYNAAVKTSLLEGRVSVSRNHEKVLLEPGQQANQLKVIKEVNMEEVMAWKNGLFQFNQTPLPEVLQQISRWYDVDIIYENKVPDINLGGEMKRDLSLLQVLKGLGKLGVSYRIEGKKLIIL